MSVHSFRSLRRYDYTYVPGLRMYVLMYLGLAVNGRPSRRVCSVSSRQIYQAIAYLDHVLSS